MNPEWFGPRLKELRESAGMSQIQLAEKTEGIVSKGTIANLEQSRCAPSWSAVVALCSALGVKSDEFMTPPSNAVKASRGRPLKEKRDEATRDQETAPEAKPKRASDKRKLK